MQELIRTIYLALPLGMGKVNCYLCMAEDGFVLVDCGGSSARKELLSQLEASGCNPGKLRLVLLTHGDFDHCGNAVTLREIYHCPIAMHSLDAEMARRGDMFYNRKRPNWLVSRLIPLFTGFGKKERFSPDFLVAEGQEFSIYGINMRALSLPGHSKGSLGYLTQDGALFCGDLMENIKTPALNSLMDDPIAGQASFQRIRKLPLTRIYPGHGSSFLVSELP